MLACHGGLDLPPGLLLLILVVLVAWGLSFILSFANLFYIFFRSPSPRFTLLHGLIFATYAGLTALIFWIAKNSNFSSANDLVAQYACLTFVFLIPAMVLGQFSYFKFFRPKLKPEAIHDTFVHIQLRKLFNPPPKPVPTIPPATPDSELAKATKLEIAGRVHEALAAYQNIIQKYPGTIAAQDAQKSFASLQSLTGNQPGP